MRHKINKLSLHTFHRAMEMLDREFRNSEMSLEDAGRIAAALERTLRDELEKYFATKQAPMAETH